MQLLLILLTVIITHLNLGMIDVRYLKTTTDYIRYIGICLSPTILIYLMLNIVEGFTIATGSMFIVYTLIAPRVYFIYKNIKE